MSQHFPVLMFLSFEKVLRILIVTISFSVSAQNTNVDSLKYIWKDKSSSDLDRISALHEIAWDGFIYAAPDSSIYFAQIEFNIAKNKGLKKQMANAMSTLGAAYYMKADYKMAIDYHFKSLDIRSTIEDKYGMSSSLNNIGAAYFDQGNYVKSIDYFLQSLKINEKLGDTSTICKSYSNIGNIYFDQNDFDRALIYYIKSMELCRVVDDKESLSYSLRNIGLVYFEREKFDLAFDYYHQSLELHKETNNVKGVSITRVDIGDVYCKQNCPTQALNLYNKSLEYYEKSLSHKELSNCLNSIGVGNRIKGDSLALVGDRFFSEKLYLKGLVYSNRALGIAQKIGSGILIKQASENLYRLHKLLRNLEKALPMYELYITYKDSLDDISSQKKIISLAFQYDYEKKYIADSLNFSVQKKMSVLAFRAEKERVSKMNFIIYGCIFFSLVLLSIYWRVKSIQFKSERRGLLQKIELLKAKNAANVTPPQVLTNPTQLHKDRIESAINASLNRTDWNILLALSENPEISNKEISEKIFLSLGGTRSSLQKMYGLFAIKTSRNQRIALIIEAVKLSSDLSLVDVTNE